jgi:predicted protein tyrosine phosphatase
MPEFTVCGRKEVPETIQKFNANWHVSTIDPGAHIMTHPKCRNRHLTVFFEDQDDPNNPRSPTEQHIKHILDWGKELPDDARVVVNCEAGCSRSTAVMFALWVQANPDKTLREGAENLVKIRPHAMPNSLIAKHADKLLNLNGEFIQECEKIALDRWGVWEIELGMGKE